MLAGALMVSFAAAAQRPPARIPTDADEVLERLPPGSTRATARRPGKRAPMDQITALLDLGARSGDPRLIERAEALLAAYPAATADAEVLRARAFVAQHGHDFKAALGHLDRIVAADPRDASALLTRSQIHVVTGDIPRAARDCVALATGVDAGLGALCTGTLSLRRGDPAAAARMADRVLDSRPPPALRRHALVLRGEAASHAGNPDADRWFVEATRVAPGDVRTLAAHARHLRRTGRHAEVRGLLAGTAATDTLLLEQALAAKAAGDADAPRLAAALARRYALARATGEAPELREEAEYMLTIRGDAARALELARENFRTQRDAEDVELLVRAATAARRPDALQEARAWARRMQVPMEASR